MNLQEMKFVHSDSLRGLTDGAVRPSRNLPNDNASLDAAFEMALGLSG